ncbi:hypothetical protein MPSEU_000644300 [Mayamaea pseudoterrestris]|nr:hypothetical protein MPSEU_000644300 [Mayamaea pseudoterrestris]
MPGLQKRQSLRSSDARTTSPSSRSLQDSCSLQRSLATTYNDDPAVPVYVGVMFSLSPLTPITVNGFDVDVRLDMVTAPEDLSVQIYHLLGEIKDSYMDSTLWTLISNTTAVMAPEKNGVIIPAASFTPVSANVGERHSFYISMTKKIIDSTVYALDKTDEVAFEGSDLTTYVGVGFTAPNFPGEYDTTVDPQFAGIIHYELADGSDCTDTSTIITDIYFDFLFSKQVTALGNVNQIVSKTLDQLMKNTPQLQQFMALYALKITSIVTTPIEYTGGCPEAWESCTSFYQSSRVLFSHLDKISSDEVKFEVYKTAGDVTTAVQKGINAVNVYYIGFESISAEYEITLEGVPAGVTMDDIQSAYFADTTSSFLAGGEQAASLPVYHVSIDDQATSRRNRVRALQASELGSSVVSGQFMGAKYHYLLDENYLSNIQSELNSNYQLYLDKLKYDGLRPGPINQDDRYTYFAKLATVRSSVTFQDAIVPQDEFPDVDANGASGAGGGMDGALIGVIAAGGGALLIIVGCILFTRLRKMNRKMVKMRDDDSDSVVFETVGKNNKNTNREPEFSVQEKPQRRRSFDAASSRPLDDFIAQRKQLDNRMSGARSVEILPISKRANGAAGMAPSAIDHTRRPGQKRSQSGNLDGHSLSNFMDKQPQPNARHMSGARSVGPGAVPDSRMRRITRENSEKASGQSLLGDFLERQPKQQFNKRSGARSVEERPVAQRQPPHVSPATPATAHALGSYLDGQSRRQDKIDGARSVDDESPRRCGRRPGKLRLDDYMDENDDAPTSPTNGSQSVGPGVEAPQSVSPEEKWGPLPKPPSMRRLIVPNEPTRGVRRSKSMDVDDRAPIPAPAKVESLLREPTRGVRRAKSMDIELRQSGNVDDKVKKKKPPPLASLQRSNSMDLDDDSKKSSRNRGIRLDAL